MLIKKIINAFKQPAAIIVSAISITTVVIVMLWIIVSLQQFKHEMQNRVLEQRQAQEAMNNAIEKLHADAQREGIISFVSKNNGLEMRAQEVGTAVIIDFVVLDQPGFVVVYSGDGNGKPGEIIASSSLLSRGIHRIVSIAIPQPLESGKKYFTELRIDVDNNKIFDKETDIAIQTIDKQPLVGEFTAKKNYQLKLF